MKLMKSVYEVDGTIVGSIIATDLGLRAYLSRLVVDKSMRNRGITKALIHEVENRLK